MWYVTVPIARQLKIIARGSLVDNHKIIRIGIPYFYNLYWTWFFNTSQGWYACPCSMRTITMIAMTNIAACSYIVGK